MGHNFNTWALGHALHMHMVLVNFINFNGMTHRITTQKELSYPNVTISTVTS
jgi:hypothetical protein